MRRILSPLLIALAFSPAGAQEAGLSASRTFRQSHGHEILADFTALLALPNVAADNRAVRRAATFIRDRLASRGVAARLLELPGAPPVVLGHLRVRGAARTLGFYVHYDGQPADATRWRHGPWTPTLYSGAMEAGGVPAALPGPEDAIDPEWRLYARSASDDKAPIAAITAVLDAFAAAGVTPTSNLVFFFEGEEEAGSPHLAQYLRRYRDDIADVDVWLFLDGPVHQSGRPQLVFGVRGVTGLEVTVYGATRSLHSGHYGNWAPVPGEDLARLLASMKDADGTVRIEGFYETVEPIAASEREALARLPNDDAALRQELGLARTEGEAPLAQRLLLPSLTIKGLASANVGPLARNVIPATATASLGIRLVKGNDAGHMLDLVEAHIRRMGYHIVRDDPDLETRLSHPRIAKVIRQGGYPAARTSMTEPIAQDIARAARQAAGDDLLLVPTLGGSLPLYLFTDVLGVPAVIMPIANHDNNQHAANENIRLANLWYAMDLYAALLTMR